MNLPTATQINLYHVCHRQLWLHSHEIRMEQESDMVYEGKLIGENTYARRSNQWREVDLGHIKIDHYDPRNKIVKEVKKSNKLEAAYIAQVKYYIYYLERNGEQDVTGLIEYPKLRRTVEVELTDDDRHLIPLWQDEIRKILDSDECPTLVRKNYCKTCSYHDFCYAQ
ncbi:MAG TPA: CRISPR-associated protein Cas4 [Saprospiraceae bacterium]|nr:CRISPR-associated protein Cas4 [Saprospiraceae bacterium]HRK82436.1 CRISPR-associated protein Cas4 [Saprospiraceae bacterium]